MCTINDEQYFVAGYWGNRPETAMTCAETLSKLISCLGAHHPALARWFWPGTSRARTLAREVTADRALMERAFRTGRVRSDANRQVIEELGYSRSFWSGPRYQESAGMSVVAGGITSTDDYVNPNLCGITLKPQMPAADELLRVETVTAVLRCIIEAWRPLDAFVESRLPHRHPPLGRVELPNVRWVTYVRVRASDVPPLPWPARVEPLDDGGVLIVLTDELATPALPAHVELASRVTEILEGVGLLRPASYV